MAKYENKDRIYELVKQRNDYIQKGKTLEEVKVLKELAELTEEVYGEESNENIQILNELGGTLKYTGEFEIAVNAIIKAKNIIEKKYGRDIVPYATCNLNLAEVYRFMKNLIKLRDFIWRRWRYIRRIICRKTIFMQVYVIILVYFIRIPEGFRMLWIYTKKAWKYWKNYLNTNFNMLLLLVIWYFRI